MRFLNMKHYISLKHIEEKKGSVTVEAAIILPIFIVVVLSVAFVINIYSIKMQVNHHITEECLRAIPKLHNQYTVPDFSRRITGRVKMNMGSRIYEIKLSNMNNNIGSKGVVAMAAPEKISVSLDYEIYNPFPINFFGDLKCNEQAYSRGFIGEINIYRDVLSYEDLEKDQEDNTVYVFPKFGSRFHGENCRCLNSYPKERLLSNHIRKRFSPCKLCKPAELINGTKIFISDNSKIYHSHDCSTVTKNYIRLTRKEAEENNYKCCEICGGK